jgi:hypothetical protein
VIRLDGNALLYLPGHSRQQLEGALRIPALSPGWRTSFQALLQNASSASPMTGNPGLSAGVGAPPAWAGFRPVRVSRIDRESRSVVSLLLEPADGRPLVAAEPGQFVVLRLRPNPDAPPVLRSYSLSDAPSTDHYRVSVKQELNGVGSAYVHEHVRVGDVLDVSAPRGNFTLQPGEQPIVLLSAGVGATPVLSMLHAHWRPKSRHGKYGGCTRLAADKTTHLRRNHVTSCKRCREAAAEHCTAGLGPRIVWVSISTPPDVSECPCSKNLVYLATPTFTCVDQRHFSMI